MFIGKINMKLLLLALFVGLLSAAPLKDEKDEPVEVIVNGLAEGEPLEIGDVLGVEVNEHIDGQVIASNNPLFPFTAEGLAAAAPEQPEEEIVIPSPVVPEIPALPEPVPEDIQAPILVIPEDLTPEVVAPPGPVIIHPLPEKPAQPGHPEIDIEIAEPVEEPNGEVFNNGVVQVQVNAEEPGMLSSIQSWFSMVVNYFNGPEQTTQQII